MARPWDQGNLEWDGNSTVSSALRTDISNLLAGTGTPQGIALSVVARIAAAGISATVAPDVFGTAAVRLAGVDYPSLTQMLNATEENAFTVEFNSTDAPGWILTTSTHTTPILITITLGDRDVIDDDPMGTVYLNQDDLRLAWNAAPDQPTWIQVSGQMKAILFIQVRVGAEP